jgi:hypothetical protein
MRLGRGGMALLRRVASSVDYQELLCFYFTEKLVQGFEPVYHVGYAIYLAY